MHIEIINCCGLYHEIKLKFQYLLTANQLKRKSEKRNTESRHTPLKLRVIAGDDEATSRFQTELNAEKMLTVHFKFLYLLTMARHASMAQFETLNIMEF